jgi:hypothetical protein
MGEKWKGVTARIRYMEVKVAFIFDDKTWNDDGFKLKTMVFNFIPQSFSTFSLTDCDEDGSGNPFHLSTIPFLYYHA